MFFSLLGISVLIIFLVEVLCSLLFSQASKDVSGIEVTGPEGPSEVHSVKRQNWMLTKLLRLLNLANFCASKAVSRYIGPKPDHPINENHITEY